MSVTDIQNIVPIEIVTGYFAKFVHTKEMTINFLNVIAGSTIPLHQHVHEQVSLVIEGNFTMIMNGEKHELIPGKVLVIPSNVLHEGIANTNCKLMDIFCPVREDYLAKSLAISQ